MKKFGSFIIIEFTYEIYIMLRKAVYIIIYIYYLFIKHGIFNTEISYSLKHKAIDIVEHRAEKI